MRSKLYACEVLIHALHFSVASLCCRLCNRCLDQYQTERDRQSQGVSHRAYPDILQTTEAFHVSWHCSRDDYPYSSRSRPLISAILLQPFVAPALCSLGLPKNYAARQSARSQNFVDNVSTDPTLLHGFDLVRWKGCPQRGFEF